MPDNLYMVGPDGTLGTIPAANEAEALGMGYRRAEQPELRDAKMRERANTPAGVLTTFLTNAGNELAFGAPEAATRIAAAKGNQTAQDFQHTGDVYSEENPIAATLGKVAGFGAQVIASEGSSLLVRAGRAGIDAASESGLIRAGAAIAGKTGARVVRTASENAAQGAALSAVASAAPAVTEAVVGDPQQAVERYIHSVGMGGLLGGVIGGSVASVGETVKAVARRASGKLSEAAYSLAAETAGLTPTQIQNLQKFHGFSVKDIGKYLVDNGIVEIGDSGQASLTKLGERMDSVGEKIGQALKSADQQAGVAPDVNAVWGRSMQRVAKPGRGTFTDTEKQTMIDTIRDHMESGDFPVNNSAEALGRYKTQLQQKIEKSFEKTSLPPTKQALMDLRDSIADELEATVQRAEATGGGPRLADYLGHKRDFELGVSLKEGFEKQAARELSPSGSLIERLKSNPTAAIGGLIGLAAGGLSGGAMLALPTAMLGAVVSNYVRRRSTSTLAGILDRASSFEFRMPKLGGLTAPAVSDATVKLTAPNFPAFSKALSTLQSQPQLVGQRLPNSNNMGVQGAMTDTVLRAHNFLYDKMPKNPSPNPFEPEGAYRPSDADLAKFNRYYTAVYDPRSAVECLTPEGIETLKAVYPTIYNDLLQGVAQHFSDKQAKGEKITYNERLHLGKFFDMPDIKGLPIFQSTFNTQPQSQASGGGQVSKAGASKFSLDDLHSTPTQRSEAR